MSKVLLLKPEITNKIFSNIMKTLIVGKSSARVMMMTLFCSMLEILTVIKTKTKNKNNNKEKIKP